MDVPAPAGHAARHRRRQLLLQQLAKDVFGAQGDPVHTPGWLDGNVDVFGYHWPYRQMFTIVLALAALGALGALLKYTAYGRQIRATVQNRDLAETMGVSTRTVDRVTFFVGSGLAGIGGVAVSSSPARTRTSGRRTSSRRSSSSWPAVSASSRAR